MPPPTRRSASRGRSASGSGAGTSRSPPPKARGRSAAAPASTPAVASPSRKGTTARKSGRSPHAAPAPARTASRKASSTKSPAARAAKSPPARTRRSTARVEQPPPASGRAERQVTSPTRGRTRQAAARSRSTADGGGAAARASAEGVRGGGARTRARAQPRVSPSSRDVDDAGVQLVPPDDDDDDVGGGGSGMPATDSSAGRWASFISRMSPSTLLLPRARQQSLMGAEEIALLGDSDGPVTIYELSLPDEAALGGAAAPRSWLPPAWHEPWNMLLLVVLYMMQAVPMGLTVGAMPFMLQSKLSYTQVGVFSMAAYPYSLKLLWSPIVDSCFIARMGRRKSWIVPVQFITAGMLVFCSGWINALYEAADVGSLTVLFTVFVLLSATQDIAVDGWALTLLKPANVGYASPCQTIGSCLGYFTSFTVFLALNNGEFCDAYLRSSALGVALLGSPGAAKPLVTLTSYLRFWGWVFASVTAAIALFQPEAEFTGDTAAARELAGGTAGSDWPWGDDVEEWDEEYVDEAAGWCGTGPAVGMRHRRSVSQREKPPPSPSPEGAPPPPPGSDDDDAYEDFAERAPKRGPAEGTALSELVSAYRQLLRVVRLPAVWGLTAFLLSYRLGVLSTESAYSLKLIDKGVAKEALAFLVLFQFPVELGTALLAGRWASAYTPYAPFIAGYALRLAVCAALLMLTASFPAGANSLAEHSGPFGMLAMLSVLSSFGSTLTFTALGSFFNRVSDPSMGGAYLTLLNTIANMGYILPRTPLFWLMDVLTSTRCTAADGSMVDAMCPKKTKDFAGPNQCTDSGGSCSLDADGFYLISWACLAMGGVIGLVYIRYLPVLMTLPINRWRARAD